MAHAVMAEQSDSVKLLVKMGASINAQDNMGRTCLSMAAYQVRLLYLYILYTFLQVYATAISTCLSVAAYWARLLHLYISLTLFTDFPSSMCHCVIAHHCSVPIRNNCGHLIMKTGELCYSYTSTFKTFIYYSI